MSTILVLERTSAGILNLGDILVVHDHTVLRCADVKELPAKAVEAQADLVVFDVATAGDADCYAVLQQVYSAPDFQPVPFLFIVASEADKAAKLRGLPFNKLHVLAKPFDIEVFLKQVSDILDHGLSLDAGVFREAVDVVDEVAPPAPGPAPAAAREAPPAREPGQNPTVLIVEDTYAVRRVVRKYVETEGYAVIEAGDGVEAVAAVSNNHVDLILLDVMLPKLDGFNVLKILKADPRYRRIPVILCTAKNQREDVILGKKLGANTYIVKPFSREILAAKMTEALAQGAPP